LIVGQRYKRKGCWRTNSLQNILIFG